MQSITKKAEEWLNPFFDAATRNTVQEWIQQDSSELEESFYKNLEFGTGGMRGLMGVGTNRINKYTIGKATLGLARYIKKQFNKKELAVAIAYDSRNNSRLFAEIAANVLASEGITAYLFSELRPTPILSYAVRELNCQAGIVITASHNPKEYNGYKVYWDDGGQLVPPHDSGVLQSVNEIDSFSQINFEGPAHLVKTIDDHVEESYLKKVKALLPTSEKVDKSIGIVFTSLHGTGITLVPKILDQLNFENFHTVKEQDVPDGNFPTVASPNPEERSALTLAIELAKEKNAELVLGTDPDADRVGLAIKDPNGEWILLNGNQAGSILVNYLLENLDPAKANESFVCKTIVTSNLIESIAAHYGVSCLNTLTGFKYIALLIKENEGKLKFIGGGEESFGYLAGDFVRDKDAVISVVIFSQIAAKCKANGSSLYQYLMDIYDKHGVYKERLVSITRQGKSGLEEIGQLMSAYRKNTPKEIGGEKVIEFLDYQNGTSINYSTGKEDMLSYDKSNVLQFKTDQGSLITVRPSGTEPKIKYYFSVNIKSVDTVPSLLKIAEDRLDQLEKAFA